MSAPLSNIRTIRPLCDVEESPLKQAISRAVYAATHLGVLLNNGGSEQAIVEAEDAADAARDNLLLEFAVLGVSPVWAKRIGEVLS